MAAQEIITAALADADVTTNGPRPWDMQVHDQRLFQRLLRDSALGLGESYMDGWWDCPALDDMIN